MNDKRARNRLAAGHPRRTGPRRMPAGAVQSDWPRRGAAHAAMRARRRMLALLSAAGWPEELTRRLLPLYPARPVDPAWAARRDAYVRRLYSLDLVRAALDRRFGPPPPPPGPEPLPPEDGSGLPGLLRRLPRRACAAAAAMLASAWLAAASPARVAAPLPEIAGPGVAGARCGGPPASGAAARPAPGRADDRNVPSVNLLDAAYLKRVLAEEDRVRVGVAADLNFDGKFNIADPLYLQSGAENFGINGFVPDGLLPVVGDSTPVWAGGSGRVSHRVDVVNLNPFDVVFRYAYGGVDGKAGIYRNPVVRAGESRSLFSLIENSDGVGSGDRFGSVFYDIRKVDGVDVDDSNVVVNAVQFVDGRAMNVSAVRSADFVVVGGSSVVPLPADVDNQDAVLFLSNPSLNPADVVVRVHSSTGHLMASKNYDLPGFGSLSVDPFDGVDPVMGGFYVDTYTDYGYFDVIPSMVLFEKNSGSVAHVPSKKVFDDRRDGYIPLVVNKELDGRRFETDTFVNNFNQVNGAQTIYNYLEDGVDHYPSPGEIIGDVLSSGEQRTFDNVLYHLWGLDDNFGYLWDGAAIYGGKLKWGVTRVVDDSGTTLVSTPGSTSADDASGGLEQLVVGLGRGDGKRSDLRVLQTSFPSDGEFTLGVYGNRQFLGYRSFDSLSLGGSVVEDVYDGLVPDGVVVKDGFVRVIPNKGAFQSFGMTHDSKSGDILWTPGRVYDHGENSAPEMECVQYLNIEDAFLCDNDGNGFIDDIINFSPTGSLKRFKLLGTDANNDDIEYSIVDYNYGKSGTLPEGVNLTPDGYLTIQPMQQYSGKQFTLNFKYTDGIDNKYMSFAYRFN